MKSTSYMILVCLLFVCVNLDTSEGMDREKYKCRKCGRSNGVPSMVINGEEVQPRNKYPWVVGLKQSNSIHCGGAIISRSFILTAAHCVQQQKMKKMSNYRCQNAYGMIGSCRPMSAKGLSIVFLDGKEESVSKVIINPGYFRQGDESHDIALVKLKRPIACNKYRSRVCLPLENYKVKPGSDVIINGWGQTYVGPSEGVGSEILKEGILTPEKNADRCGSKETDDGKMMRHCLIGKQDDGPCFGDSGGSALSLNGNKYFTIGVASQHTSTTCELNSPAAYTNVQAYLPWIMKETGLKPPKRMRSI